MLMPLDLLGPGEWGEVADVSGEPGWVGRLAELGLREGTQVCVLRPGTTCLLNVSGCRLCLRGGESAQILVRPVSEPTT